MKLHEETTDELTRAVLATVAQKLQQERALLPCTVSIILDSCPQAMDNEELYLELGDGTVKFSARWLINQLITFSHT